MRRLRDLKAREISLTKAGANRRVILTYKSADKGEPMPKAPSLDQLRKQVANIDPSVEARLDAMLKAAGDDAEVSPKAASILKAIGRLLSNVSDEVSPDQIVRICEAAGLRAPNQEALMDKAAKAPKADQAGEDEEAEDEEEDDEDEAEATEEGDDEEDDDAVPAKKAANVVSAHKIEQDRTNSTPSAHVAKARPSSEPKGGNVAEDEKVKVDKAATLERLQKSNESLLAQVEELRKNAEKAEKARKDEIESRDRADMLKTVQDNYGSLGLDADKLAPALFELKKSGNAEHFNAVVDTLQSQVDYRRQMEKIGGPLFKSIGSSGSSREADMSPDAQMERDIAEMAKKAEYIGKSRAQVSRDYYDTPRGRELKQQSRQMARGEV